MAAHSPGPWHVSGDLHHHRARKIVFGGGRPSYAIADTAMPHGRWTDDEEVANARLIASSPRLLAALKGMVKWHANRFPAPSEDEIAPIEQQPPEVAEAMRAIAEATGEQA